MRFDNEEDRKNQKLQISILGFYDEEIRLIKTEESSVIVTNSKETLQSKIKAINAVTPVMKNINNSSYYYTITVLRIDNLNVEFYNIDSYYEVTMAKINETLDIIKRVLYSEISTSIVRYPSGNVIFSSDTCLNNDGSYTITGFDYTNTSAEKYYAVGEYDKMLRYLFKDKFLREYKVLGYLSRELLDPNRTKPLKEVEVYINSKIITFGGFPAAIEEYSIAA
ncbi:hypothetical protein Tery_4258 [Trichodesmium erythraeum IMS101]|uniref:Uncharacterized protein n=1 Tax=Trichodesmium erythraeum (strain IMS101) TaxID=203124 RepID=Q10WW8_TRIEI|nr:hypothetical protein [Trichodesmium erythraeum GBRTRLIN201]